MVTFLFRLLLSVRKGYEYFLGDGVVSITGQFKRMKSGQPCVTSVMCHLHSVKLYNITGTVLNSYRDSIVSHIPLPSPNHHCTGWVSLEPTGAWVTSTLLLETTDRLTTLPTSTFNCVFSLETKKELRQQREILPTLTAF